MLTPCLIPNSVLYFLHTIHPCIYLDLDERPENRQRTRSMDDKLVVGSATPRASTRRFDMVILLLWVFEHFWLTKGEELHEAAKCPSNKPK